MTAESGELACFWSRQFICNQLIRRILVLSDILMQFYHTLRSRRQKLLLNSIIKQNWLVTAQIIRDTARFTLVQQITHENRRNRTSAVKLPQSEPQAAQTRLGERACACHAALLKFGSSKKTNRPSWTGFLLQLFPCQLCHSVSQTAIGAGPDCQSILARY